MENAPSETVVVWMRQTNLNPRNLMPALLKYDHSKAPENTAQVCLFYFIFIIEKI